MIENPKLRKMKRSVESGVTFSRLYFSKPTSVVLVTVYISALVLAFGTLGLSKLINPLKENTEIPTIPETTFAFLPADNVEVPGLGEVEESSEEEPAEENSSEATSEAPAENSTSENYRAPATVQVPVIVEVPKETVKEVVKTVEVEKEVTREVAKEVPSVVDESRVDENIQNASEYQQEQINYDNFNEPVIEDLPEAEEQKDNDE